MSYVVQYVTYIYLQFYICAPDFRFDIASNLYIRSTYIHSVLLEYFTIENNTKSVILLLYSSVVYDTYSEYIMILRFPKNSYKQQCS